jgi:glycosidase
MVVNHVGYETRLVKEKPEWFHHRGTIVDWDDEEQVVEFDVHGLPDLAQERPEVYDYLMGAAQNWRDVAAVDGFRLDAVKHVPMDFWHRYNGELLRSDPNFVLLGELYDGAPAAVADVRTRGRFTHMLDFPLAFALRDVFCGGRSPGAIGAVLYGDRFYTQPQTMVTFIDNHDLPRVRSVCGDDMQRVRRALTALLALRGVPVLTYGTEAGLAGEREPLNRGDMVFDPVAGSDLREGIHRAMALRREHGALAHGESRVIESRKDVLWILRGGATGEAAVIVINGGADERVPLPAALEGAHLRDAYGGDPVSAPVALASGDVRVLLAENIDATAVERASSGRRAVRWDVRGVTLGDDESVVVVGSGPELGEWAPVAAPSASAALELPVGGMFDYKLVVRGPRGTARWEEGQNRHLFVRPGEGPEVIAVAWGEGA